LVVLCETNVLSLISQRLNNYYQIQTKYYSIATLNFGTPNLGTTHSLRSCLVSKNFQDFPSHRMFGHMYRALNVDEKKLITQFGRKPRDKSFKLN
jgi:hypothetical protein